MNWGEEREAKMLPHSQTEIHTQPQNISERNTQPYVTFYQMFPANLRNHINASMSNEDAGGTWAEIVRQISVSPPSAFPKRGHVPNSGMQASEVTFWLISGYRSESHRKNFGIPAQERQ